MPIKFNCYKCGAKLRVPDQHIGKQARCPKCDEKCVVPEISQLEANSSLDGNFDNLGEAPGSPTAIPVDMSSATTAPVAAAQSPIPPIASPFTSPVSPAPQMVHSPYAAPMTGKPNAVTNPHTSIMHPLYEPRGMMKLFGWTTFIVGILSCVTIFGAVVGWLYRWIGWLIKGSAEALTNGVETGDQSQLRLANERLGTFFKIIGVLTIIWLALMSLYLVLILVGIVLAVAGAASGL